MARGIVIPVGEAALLLRPAGPRSIPALLRAVEAARDPRVLDTVPGADSILVTFEGPPSEAERARLLRIVESPPPNDDDASPPLVHRVPVAYDGPDLERVARHAGLRVREVIDLHCATEYRVAFIGFQPGFAYLSGLAPRLQVPRLGTPRARVLPGSVGIGGEWTGVYPSASPGGWNLVGRTDLRMFDPASDRPTRLGPGDLVRFVSS